MKKLIIVVFLFVISCKKDSPAPVCGVVISCNIKNAQQKTWYVKIKNDTGIYTYITNHPVLVGYYQCKP